MNEEAESAALQKGTETYKNSNKNYDKPPPKSPWIKFCIYALIIIVLILLGIGLYFLIQYLLSASDSPSLNYVPNVEGSAIKYTRDNHQKWTKVIDEDLKAYSAPCDENCNLVNCDFPNVRPAGKSCKFDLKKLGPCSKENSYGFSRYSPCIFLKLDLPMNWEVETFNDTKNLPAEMPKDLKRNITNIPYIYNILQQPTVLNTIWVRCEPFMSTTNEDAGPIAYHPQPGFPGYFYPQESEDFNAPLVAVRFLKPKLNKPIHIQCTTWAKNLQVTTSFEFQID